MHMYVQTYGMPLAVSPVEGKRGKPQGTDHESRLGIDLQTWCAIQYIQCKAENLSIQNKHLADVHENGMKPKIIIQLCGCHIDHATKI